MTNFESFHNVLESRTVSYRESQIDIDSLQKVRMLSSQKKFFSGLAYIGTQKQFDRLSEFRVYAGTALIACEAREPLLAAKSEYDGAALIELSCSMADAFNVLSKCLSSSNQHPMEDTRVDLLSVWDRIMTGKLVADQDVQDSLSNAGVVVHEFYRMAVASFDMRNVDDSTLIELRDKLDILLPLCEIFRYNNSLIMIIFHDERVFTPVLPEKELLELLEEYKASVMAGYALRNYSAMRTQFLMCQRTHELSYQIDGGRGSRILSVNEYLMYYVIDLCTQRYAQIFGHMDILMLTHPAIINLKRYDAAHNSNYMGLLQSYLKNDGNITKTAKEVYMHRNTAINKMNKIREMLPQDLRNGILRQQLLFGCQTLEFYEKILNFDIRKV